MTTLDAPVVREPETASLDALTTELNAPMAAPADKCPSCASSMARDQRYCIHCGERRSGGGLRDALPRTPTTVAAAPPRRPRMSANTNLIAGIATLLIAMGVGVLIGRTGDHTSKSAGTAPVQVIRVAGDGAAGTTAAAAGTAGATTKTAKKAKAKKAKASTAATQQTASQNHVKLPPPVVKVGGTCTTKGAKGCQKGKFTGNFFGQ